MALVGGENEEKIKNWVRAGGRQPGTRVPSAVHRGDRASGATRRRDSRTFKLWGCQRMWGGTHPVHVGENPVSGHSHHRAGSGEQTQSKGPAELGIWDSPPPPEGLCSCIFVVVRIGLRLFKCSISSVSILVIHIFKAFRVFYVVEIIYLNCS